MKPETLPPEPKYAQIARTWREQVRSGVLKPGDKLPSYPEMKARGVSQPTLDRVHAILERDGLVTREKGRGVFVATVGSKATRRTIACSVPGAEYGAHPYWQQLLEGVRQAARENDCDLFLPSSELNIDWNSIDGLLHIGYNGLRSRLNSPGGIPVAGLMIDGVCMPVVYADEFDAMVRLTQYLVKLGHRRIAYMVSPHTPARHEGYNSALREAGIKPNPRWIRQTFDLAIPMQEMGYHAMVRWLAEDWAELGCTALMVHNDDGARGVLKALKEAGINVPHDLSLTGFDGTEVSEHLTPPLTTMKVPLLEIGRRGLELLLRQPPLFGPSETVLPCTLVERDSTAPPR